MNDVETIDTEAINTVDLGGGLIITSETIDVETIAS